MLIGIGTDIVEIERIQKAITRTPYFIEKTLTQNEQLEYVQSGSKVERIAGSFAAKEAVSKALGTGFRSFSMQDIEILRDRMGKPYVVLYNNAKTLMHDRGGNHILLSISHCKAYAVAMVTIEGSDKCFI